VEDVINLLVIIQ